MLRTETPAARRESKFPGNARKALSNVEYVEKKVEEKGREAEWLRRCMNIKTITALNKARHRGGTITGIVGKPDAQLPLDLMGR